MRRLRTTSRDVIALPCEGGMVACPARGNVDVERCWHCPSFLGMRDGDHGDRVVCSPLAPGDPMLYPLF